MSNSTTIIQVSVTADWRQLCEVSYKLQAPTGELTARTTTLMLRAACARAIKTLEQSLPPGRPQADAAGVETLEITVYRQSAYRHNELAHCALPAAQGVLDGAMVADIARHVLLEVVEAMPDPAPDWHDTSTAEAAEDER